MARWIAIGPALSLLLAAGCASGKAGLVEAVQTQIAGYRDRNCAADASIVSVRVKQPKITGDTASATAIVAIKFSGDQTGRNRFQALVSCMALYPPAKTPWGAGETKGVAYSAQFEKRASAWAITHFNSIGIEDRGKITPWAAY